VQPGQRDNLLVVIVVGVGMALLAAVFAVGLAARAVHENGTGKATLAAGPSTGMQNVDVTLEEFKITPATITVTSGTGMLRVTNKGTMAHNLTVVGQNLATSNINPGGNQTLDVMSLAAGSYQVICSVPGHAQSGMTATLVVTGNGAASNNGAPAAGTMTVDQMDAMMAANMKAFPAKTQGQGGSLLAPTIRPDGTKQFDLTAKVVKWEVSPGKFVDAWTYNGMVPGPTIHVNIGDKVAVVLHNELPESTVIHFHGIRVPNAMDGVPDLTQPPVKPGQSFTYSFVAQGPAVGMYHSHYDAVKQVPNGLAGAFLVGEEPLPGNVKPTQELSMMLDDSGTLGITINGKSFPATAPVVAHFGDEVLVHYMNEGQMIHPMHLHGIPQTVVAQDGFPVPAPYQEDTVMVAPGQRISVLIKADELGAWAWHCHILSHAENDQGMYGMVTALIVQ
jgi:FtsP/CotA-like multicopper oxidase with cupredoxin domain